MTSPPERTKAPSPASPQQGRRADTIFVIIAVMLNQLMLAIDFGIAQDAGENGAAAGRQLDLPDG